MLCLCEQAYTSQLQFRIAASLQNQPVQCYINTTGINKTLLLQWFCLFGYICRASFHLLYHMHLCCCSCKRQQPSFFVLRSTRLLQLGGARPHGPCPQNHSLLCCTVVFWRAAIWRPWIQQPPPLGTMQRVTYITSFKASPTLDAQPYTPLEEFLFHAELWNP